MRVTVTRPEHSGLKTAARLKALGHEPIVLPLSEPVHNIETIKQVLKKPFSSVAITSAEALAALATLTFDSLLLQKTLVVVGEPSAAAARDFGFTKILIANGFATGMVDMLANLPAHERSLLSPMLYLAGTPRGDIFEEGLRSLNIAFEAIDAYEMMKRKYTPSEIAAHLALGKPDGVLFFSSEAVKNYFSLLTPYVSNSYFNDIKFFCISEKTAANLPEHLSSQSIISKETSEQGIIDLLAIISGT